MIGLVQEEKTRREETARMRGARLLVSARPPWINKKARPIPRTLIVRLLCRQIEQLGSFLIMNLLNDTTALKGVGCRRA